MTNFQSKFPPILYYLVSVFVVVFLVGLTGVLRPVRRFSERNLIIPVKQKVYDWQRFFKKDLNGCELKNERELMELKTKIASLTEENLAQKRLLSAPLPKNWQYLPTRVIFYSEETLTIDVGEEDGVKTGMTALSGNTFLGKVFLVSERQSLIRLPSFPEEKMSASVFSENGKALVGKGLLVGRGAGRMKLEQVLRTENVEEGNIVLAAVDGGSPLTGVIEKVDQKEGEMFKSADVKRVYNPEELGTVFLIRGKL